MKIHHLLLPSLLCIMCNLSALDVGGLWGSYMTEKEKPQTLPDIPAQTTAAVALIPAKKTSPFNSIFDAMHKGEQEAIQWLSEHPDIQMDVKETFGRTPLAQAAERNYLTLAQQLLERKANVVQVDTERSTLSDGTPLGYAASNGHTQMLRLLLSHSPTPASSTTALFEMVKGDGALPAICPPMPTRTFATHVRLLINNGADINARDRHGGTPLYHRLGKNPATVRILLQQRANPEEGNTSALHKLAFCIFKDEIPHVCATIPLVLAFGANIEDEDGYGFTSLMYATDANNPEIVKKLLMCKADPKHKNKAGRDARAIARTPEMAHILDNAQQYAEEGRLAKKYSKKLAAKLAPLQPTAAYRKKLHKIVQ